MVKKSQNLSTEKEPEPLLISKFLKKASFSIVANLTPAHLTKEK